MNDMNVVPKHYKQFNKILLSYHIIQSTNAAVLSLRMDAYTLACGYDTCSDWNLDLSDQTNRASVHPMCKQKRI